MNSEPVLIQRTALGILWTKILTLVAICIALSVAGTVVYATLTNRDGWRELALSQATQIDGLNEKLDASSEEALCRSSAAVEEGSAIGRMQIANSQIIEYVLAQNLGQPTELDPTTIQAELEVARKDVLVASAARRVVNENGCPDK